MPTDASLFPLSLPQRTIGIDQMLHGDDPVYLLAGYYVMPRVSAERLEDALQIVLKRHKAIRAIFVHTEQGLGQRFAEVAGPVLDIREYPETEANDERALDCAIAEARRPIPLLGGRLFRFTLCRGKKTDVWAFTFHHVAIDAYGVALFTKEVAAAYSAIALEEPPDFLASIQADLSYAASSAIETDREFWRSKLSQGTERLFPPLHQALYKGPTYPAGHVTLTIEHTDYDRMVARAKERGFSFLHLALGALACMLAPLTDSGRVTIGVALANRLGREARRTCGLYANVIPIAIPCDPAASVEDLLTAIRAELRACYRHQRLPSNELLRLGTTGEGNMTGLYDIAVTYMDLDFQIQMEGVSICVNQIETDAEQLPLCISIRDYQLAQPVELSFMHSLAHLAKSDVEAITRHFQHILGYMVDAPQARLGELDILPPKERAHLAKLGDGVPPPESGDRTLAARISEQAAKTPGAIALISDGATWTYSELETHAMRIAGALTQAGVREGSRVVVYARRGPEVVAAMLGLWRCGATYVPVEPTTPAERLLFILNDCDASAVLTQADWLARFSSFGRPVLALETAIAEDRRTLAPPSHPGARSDAYVIYTSGSTGTPKGVRIGQAAITRHILAMREVYALRPSTTVLEFASFAFDASLEVMLAALSCGGSVVVRGDTVWTAAELHDVVQRHRIEVVNLPPAYLAQWVQAWPTLPPLERGVPNMVIAGGDVLNPSAARALLDAGLRVLNAYGPTECTITATLHEITREDTMEGRALPIGRPLPGRKLRILGPRGQLLAVGSPGELFIGGPLLAEAYLGRHELTEARFVPDPESPGQRLYRTGDLCRWREDGSLEFLGRLDNQIKVNGHRVELGEIEAAARRHPAVTDCAAVLTRDGDSARLVIHYSGTARAEALRDDLARMQPPYMVPSVLLKHDALPLTHSGKVDRRALDSLRSVADSRTKEAESTPQTPTETRLGDLWKELLRRESVGRHDDFISLGGDSLTAIRLALRIQGEFGIAVTLRDILDHTRLSDFASVIDQSSKHPQKTVTDKDRHAEAVMVPPCPSQAQRRLWFVAQLEGRTATFNMPGALRLQGALKPEALAKALAALVQRHEVLRYRFPECDGEPTVIISAEPFRLEMASAEGLSAGEREQAITDSVSREARHLFDLAQGPLFRARLLRFSEEDHVLFLNMHHIVSDDWSIEILLRELSALYAAFSRGQPSPLPPLKISFGDYARHDAVQTQAAAEAQLSYWKDALSGAPPLLLLPTDRPRPHTMRFVGRQLDFSLDAASSEGMRKLARQHKTTLFTTMLAAFAVLLYKHSRQSDLVVGTPVANRTRPGTGEMVGLFVNVLPLRLNLDGTHGFESLLDDVRTRTMEAFARSETPFEYLVEKLAPQRELSHTPLFQVMFDLLPERLGVFELEGLSITELPVGYGISKYDLSMTLKDGEGPLSGSIEYNTDLFDDATIERLAGHYRTLVAAISSASTEAVDRLPLMAGEELARTLALSRPEHSTSLSGYEPVISLFEAQARMRPEAEGLVFRQERLTYGMLDARASALAGRLARAGAEPGKRIGLFLDYSPDVVIAVLAVLKTGAAYVPLAREDARFRHILRDAALTLVVTRTDYAGLIEKEGVPVVLIEGNGTPEARSFRGPRVEAGHHAYVLYTSGSTGTPKGVAISNGSLASAYSAWSLAYPLGPSQTNLLSASHTFDVFTGELVRSLCSGARMVMCPRELLLDAPELCALIRREAVTFAELVPVVLRQLIAELQTKGTRLETLRTLACGSDAWFAHEGRAIRALCPNARVYNTYGATEATIDSTLFDIENLQVEGERFLPIGRPLANTDAFILDAQLRPLPVGIPGELVLGGPALADGYWRRPDLTAARFVATPEILGARSHRLYRTGDLCRWLADGNIEFLGRLDHQVKVRGFRVELAEIEHVLSDHPGIAECVVVARPDSTGETALIAYFRGSLDCAAARAHLKERLPAHMVPNRFIRVERFALTSSGKIDRNALPQASDEETPGVAVAPRNEAERRMARIWASVLGAKGVGVHDDFFALGGHSLLAAKLIAAVQAEFARRVPISTLFSCPTVAQLTQAIGQLSAQDGPIPVALGVERQRLSFSQRRLWFLHATQVEPAAYNVPDVVRLRGRLDIDALEAALQDLVARHESLHTSYSPTVQTLTLTDGRLVEEPIRQVCPPPTIRLPLLDLSRHPEQAGAFLSQEARTPFDLTGGLPFRFMLLRLGQAEHILSVVIHHIATDGQSSRIFWDELSQLYAARLEGKTGGLAKPVLQEADFAAYQRLNVESQSFAGHLDYWRTQLADPPDALGLYTDAPRSSKSSLEGASLTFELSSDLSRQLEALCKGSDCSLFMLLHASFAALLYRHTGQDDLVIGSPFSGRELPEFESVIGCLINLLPLRLKVDGDAPFADLLQAAKRVSLAAQAHQTVPFDVLVERLHPERIPGQHPFFDVMLALQADGDTHVTMPGLQAESVHVDLGKAKLDLTLVIQRGPDGLRGMFEYRRDLFEPDSIQRLKTHFERLLESIAENPHRSVATLGMLTSTETRWLLHDCNDTLAPYPSETCLHELVERQARRLPDKIALEMGDLHVSYAGMMKAAERLAASLCVEHGVVQGDRVGLLIGSHPNMPVAMLAVMMAGAAYTPLDTEAPHPRLRGLLKAADCKLVVCHRPTAQTAADLGAPVLDMDMIPQGAEAAGSTTPVPATRLDPDLAANVIFTSGSTGTPKGVAVAHRGLVNLMQVVLRTHALGETSRQLQHLATHFDAALLDMLGPLTAGGTVVFASKMDRLPGPPLVALLGREHITHLIATPSVLQVLPRTDLPELAVLIAGGEACPDDLAAHWAKGRHLINGYGPTETSVCVSSTSWHEEHNRMVLRPIANTRFHVLDRHLNLLPAGVPGELCIAGLSVAIGYVNDAELTAKVFVRDPFDPSRKGRLYRTGDRTVRLPDGSLKFLGRLDDQVKIRGFRVEPGEVEAALRAAPGVVDGAVNVRRDARGTPQLVAYAVGSVDAKGLRTFLKDRLPAHMVPQDIVLLSELPRSASGKLDKKALPPPHKQANPQSTAATAGTHGHEEGVAGIWRDILKRDDIGPDDNFFDVGGHSILVAALQQRLETRFSTKVPLTAIFQHPTIREQARLLAAKEAPQPFTARLPDVNSNRAEDDRDVAIIGMAGRFPGARTLQEFWSNLLAGREAVTFYTREELLFRGVDPAILDNPHYVRSGISLEGIDLFDSAFFGYTPREAQLLDPQHRLFLECAHEALENAGYGSSENRPAIGVYASASISHYLLRNLMPRQQSLGSESMIWLTGNDKDFLPTRTAYALNLRGPAVSVGTACSSSLVAVHLAAAALRRGECAMALAGGCSLEVEQSGYLYQEGSILSPDGRCRAFDADARGTSSGSGCAIVLLKPLKTALADHDPILAVIKGSAINNDGNAKVGYTAPSVQGQSAVIHAALQDARVSPDSITYVETHGTGTQLGDPIEIQALTQAYVRSGEDFAAHSCALGALKTNIGHLDATSGAAGLIKTVLALRHAKIPPHANFTTPNPAIHFASGPFFVPEKPLDWNQAGKPRRAAISSFGIGGTNVHMVLEAAPAQTPEGAEESTPQIIPLSARTPGALARRIDDLAEWLESSNEPFADAAWTLQTGRTHFVHRAAVVCKNGSEARTRLLSLSEREGSARASRKPVFVFPGQGSQYVGMARTLYQEENVFRSQLDTCAGLLAPALGFDLLQLIHAPASEAEAAKRLRQTRYAQPALFSVEYALARLLMDWGIVPEAMIGHSIGEYVAACLAGVFDLSDALKLVAARGALMQEMPSGAMLAVLAAEEKVAALLGGGIDLAAVNSPGTCVLSGSHEAIGKTEATCQTMGLACRRLETSHAFHSSMMEDAARRFREVLAGVPAHAPQIPVASNLTGGWLTEQQTKNPAYWADQLRHTVRFGAAVATVMGSHEAVWFEVGPNRPLSDLLRRSTKAPVYPILPKAEEPDDTTLLKEALAGAWVHGAKVNWPHLHRGRVRRRVAMPTYPFERTRAWLEAPRQFSAPPALVRTWTEAPDGSTSFRVTLPHDHWLVAEHRVFDGRPVLPGTGCLELVRHAYGQWTGETTLELRDVYFLRPLVLLEDTPREALLVLVPLAGQKGRYSFTLSSDAGTHAQGEIGPIESTIASTVEAPDMSREGLREVAADSLYKDSTMYGPRWHCLTHLWLGQDRGLARLVLSPDHAGDLPRHALHPALLDMATAFLSLGQADAAALPFHYQRLILRAPLSSRLWSRARKTGPLSYDIVLFESEEGQAPRVLAEITGYTLKAAAQLNGPDSWCLQPQWVPSPDAKTPASELKPWLVFAAADMPSDPPAGSIRVRPGTRFAQTGRDEWSVRPRSSDDIRTLIQTLAENGSSLQHVVFAWSLDKPDAQALVALVQGLSQGTGTVHLTVLTRDALAGGAVDAAATGGILQSVSWEFPRIRCRHLDLQGQSDSRTFRDALALALSRPFPDAKSPRPEIHRITEAGLQALNYRPLSQGGEHPPHRDGEVWLITGGLGGIGLALAEHLSKKATLHFVLVSRSGELPASDHRSARIAALKARSAGVTTVQADVSNATDMGRAIAQARNLGPLAGVIHAAGVEASGLLETLTPERMQAVLAPKIEGGKLLHTLLRDSPPKTVLLCSSLASLVGGLGQADYAAANAALDALAHKMRAEGLPATSINWDAWSETGMASRFAAKTRSPADATPLLSGLTTAEGCAVFDYILKADAPQVVVSKRPLESLFQPVMKNAQASVAVARTRTVPYVAPTTRIERELANIWSEVLGIEEVGVNDHFNELGGHSLLATQVVSRVRDSYSKAITLAAFLESPTIAFLARALGEDGTEVKIVSQEWDIRYCLQPLQGHGKGTPFFCVPGMGGNVAQLMPLSNALGQDRPFIGLQSLGLDGKAQPHRSAESMAAHYIRCIRAVQPKGPYLLGGHSLGSKVAWEMAHQLHKQGERVALLAHIDSAAPPYRESGVMDDATAVGSVLNIYAHIYNKPLNIDLAEYQRLKALAPAPLFEYLKGRLASEGIIRREADDGAIRGLVNVFKATSEFRYNPPLDAGPFPSILFKGRDPMPHTIQLPEIRENDTWGWEKFTTEPVQVLEVPGDHFSCLSAGNVSAMATVLRERLHAADPVPHAPA